MPAESSGNMLSRPLLRDLGADLTRISSLRRSLSLLSPFMWALGYVVLAIIGLWAPAIFCLCALSFVTYGSVSHDLVHRNLGLPRRLNDFLLVIIELLALRSGMAYRLSHLHHHRRFPKDDDVEGAAAGMSLTGALIEGMRFQLKLFRWSWRIYPEHRRQLSFEGTVILIAYLSSVIVLPWTAVPFVYVVLITVGAWIIPLITSYIPHDPTADGEIFQTRVFRGRVLSIVAFNHLYHLEHHLYPAVPHHNWPELARRLDPYLEQAGVRPIRLWF